MSDSVELITDDIKQQVVNLSTVFTVADWDVFMTNMWDGVDPNEDPIWHSLMLNHTIHGKTHPADFIMTEYEIEVTKEGVLKKEPS